jgi:alpha-L-fucosidase
MNRGKIPVSEYKAYAKEFNPVKYNPDEWVRMAKDAGMKYIVITAKHHDGFALFDSKVDDWDVVDATPYKKDLLKPLVAAAKKQDMKIGFYYSQAQDWIHPGGAKAGYKEGGGWDPAQNGSFDDYLENVAAPQVDEIMSNYAIDVLWWDTPVWMNKKRADLLLPLLNKRPGIIHNNRLGGGYRGDTDTPEQHIPATGIKGRDWETCMTMNGTWGYKSYDHNWKSSEKLIRNLVDIVSKGGNYLLNVGPKPDGTFPAESVNILKDVGQWMKVNGEGIYGTKASPCKKPSWGRLTRKDDGKNTALYLHIFKWPKNGEIRVDVANKVLSAELLADSDRKITAEQGGMSVLVKLTGDAPDKICSVVKLVIEGKPVVTDKFTVQSKDGSVKMKAGDASFMGSGQGAPNTEEKGGVTNIGFWHNPKAWVQWTVRINTPGVFAIKLDVASEGSSKLALVVTPQKGKQLAKTDIALANTGNYASFKTLAGGSVEIKKPGIYKIALIPDAKSWSPVNVRQVVLVKK